MRNRSTLGVFATLGLAVTLAAAAVLGGCRNGPNNARDTNGMSNSEAAGQVLPGTVGGGAPSSATAATDSAAKTDSAKHRTDTTRRP